MSEIMNTGKTKFPLISAIRGLLEHRALWLYYLYDESQKHGIDITKLAERGINRCGIYQGNNLIKKNNIADLKGLRKSLFGFFARKVFEITVIKSTESELHLHFHYCPLVKAWQKQNCSDDEIGTLCDLAMCGDRGIAEAYNADLVLGDTIAHKGSYCDVKFIKKKIENESLMSN